LYYFYPAVYRKSTPRNLFKGGMAMPTAKWIIVAGFLFVQVIGCSDKSVKTDVSALNKEGERAPAEALDAKPWPEQWVVVEEERWVPVLVDLDRHLAAARTAFVKGDRKGAKAALDAGAAWLQKEKNEAREKRVGEYNKAISELMSLAMRVEKGDKITLAEFDKGLGKTYPEDLEGLWSVQQVAAVYNFMEQPSPHFVRARELLGKKDGARAAYEVRRGADWLALVAVDSGKGEDRDRLQKAVANLRRVASDMENGRIASPNELNKALAEADRSYAIYYLHWAERAQRERMYEELAAPLKALAARLEAGAKWAGRNLDEGEAKLISRLRAMSSAVKTDGARAEKDVREVLKSVRKQLGK
jgi:hypothetical protein